MNVASGRVAMTANIYSGHHPHLKPGRCVQRGRKRGNTAERRPFADGIDIVCMAVTLPRAELSDIRATLRPCQVPRPLPPTCTSECPGWRRVLSRQRSYQLRSGFGSIIGSGAAGAGSCFVVLQPTTPSTSAAAITVRSDLYNLFM